MQILLLADPPGQRDASDGQVGSTRTSKGSFGPDHKKSNLFFPDKKMTTNKDFENTFFPFLLLSSFLPLLPGYLGLCTRSTLRFFVIFFTENEISY